MARITREQADAGQRRNPDAANKSPGAAIGLRLIRAGVITAEQRDAALETQRKTFLPLGRILRDEHGLNDAALLEALQAQSGYTRIYLRFFPIEAPVLSLLDPPFCRAAECLAIEKLDGVLCVAFSKLPGPELLKRVEDQTGLRVRPFLAPWEDIQRKLQEKAE
jgi:hypothetical protein